MCHSLNQHISTRVYHTHTHTHTHTPPPTHSCCFFPHVRSCTIDPIYRSQVSADLFFHNLRHPFENAQRNRGYFFPNPQPYTGPYATYRSQNCQKPFPISQSVKFVCGIVI